MKKCFILIVVVFIWIPLVPLFSEEAPEGASDIEEILIDYFSQPFERLEFTQEELDFIESKGLALTQREYSIDNEETITKVKLAAPKQEVPSNLLKVIDASRPEEWPRIQQIILRSHSNLRFLEYQLYLNLIDKETTALRIKRTVDEGNRAVDEFNELFDVENHVSALERDEDGNFKLSQGEVRARSQAQIKAKEKLATISIELDRLIARSEFIEWREELLITWIKDLAKLTTGFFSDYTAFNGDEILYYKTLIDIVYEKADIDDLRELGAEPITITTEPAGASLFFEGQAIGNAPVTLPWLLPGEYQLSAKQDLYKEAVISYTPGESSKVTIPMEKKATGYLVLDLYSHRGKLSIDGRQRSEEGKGKFELTTGPHSVRFEPSDSSYGPLEREITIEEGKETLLKSELQGFGRLDLSMEWGYRGDFILSSEEHGRYTAGEGEYRLPEGKWKVKGLSNQGIGRSTVHIESGETTDLEMAPAGRSELIVAGDYRTLKVLEGTVVSPSGFGFGLRYNQILGRGGGFFLKSMTGYTRIDEDDITGGFAEDVSLIEERISLGYHVEFLGDGLNAMYFGVGPAMDYLYCTAQSPFMSSASEAGQIIGGGEVYLGVYFGQFYADVGYTFFFEGLVYPALEPAESYYNPSSPTISVGYRFNLPSRRNTKNLPSIKDLERGGIR